MATERMLGIVGGVGLIRPDEADRAFIHEVYFNQLVKGRFTDETRAPSSRSSSG